MPYRNVRRGGRTVRMYIPQRGIMNFGGSPPMPPPYWVSRRTTNWVQRGPQYPTVLAIWARRRRALALRYARENFRNIQFRDIIGGRRR